MPARMEVSGFSQIQRRLEELYGPIAEKTVNKALRAGAEVLNEGYKNNAPKSDNPRQPKPSTQLWRTGDHAYKLLKVSSVKSLAGPGAKAIDVGIQKGDNSKAFYLKFFEWGSSKMKAQPFMGPINDRKASEVFNAIKDEMKRGYRL